MQYKYRVIIIEHFQIFGWPKQCISRIMLYCTEAKVGPGSAVLAV